MLTDLLLSGDWALPVLARPGPAEQEGGTLALVAGALARGNSKTEGFKSRVLPLGGEISRALGAHRERLHELARQQIEEIDTFDKTLGFALALVAAGGNRDRVKREHYAYAVEARYRFDRAADGLFFDHLWRRFAAQDRSGPALNAVKTGFAKALFAAAEETFEASLPAVPCAGIFRLRAEIRAQTAFFGRIRHQFPELFETPDREDPAHARLTKQSIASPSRCQYSPPDRWRSCGV